MDNTDKFENKAAAYSSGRPSYATAFIDMLYTRFGFTSDSTVADIGSGTGILSRQLLERGSTVYAVEPNADMRGRAELELGSYGKFRSVNGTAEHTGLKDGSVDFITAAQAFHWFDVEGFKAECRRILKPSGEVFLVWNTRDVLADVSRQHIEIIKKYCPDFTGFNGGSRNDEKKIAAFFGGTSQCEEFDNPLVYDREKFIRRSLSSSYSPTERDENHADYLKALNALFDRYAEGGVLSVPNKTRAYFKAGK